MDDDQVNLGEPKEKWETPELKRDNVQETTEAGFNNPLIENMFYTDS